MNYYFASIEQTFIQKHFFSQQFVPEIFELKGTEWLINV